MSRGKKMKLLVFLQNSTTEIARYNTFHFFRYLHFKYPECLFTNIQKQ